MSYYWFNGKELLRKAKKKCENKGGQEKAARNRYKKLSEKEKELKR